MDQPKTTSFSRSTGALQAFACLVAFLFIAIVLSSLDEGGLAANRVELTIIAGIVLALAVVLLQLQHAATVIEADLLRSVILNRLDFQDGNLRSIERNQGNQGFLALLVNRQHATVLDRFNDQVRVSNVTNNVSNAGPLGPPPGTLTGSHSGSLGGHIAVTEDDKLSGTRGPGGELLVGAPRSGTSAAAKKAPAKKAAAKKAAPVKKAAAVNRPRRTTDDKA